MERLSGHLGEVIHQDGGINNLSTDAKALETFQLNKAPGNDGIPIEFYKTFWSLISEPFVCE